MSEEKVCTCESCPDDCVCKIQNGQEVKDTWFWIKDSRGYGSVTVTFVTIAFWVTTVAYIFSIVEKIGPFAIRPFDVAATTAYFVPLLSLYGARKFTEAKYPSEVTKENEHQK